ncbi:hypothetical protein FRC09_015864 [Ceratobasidium sp. 395]|nr:hypothetical protein FRC09_015864 [Ceratobasidium sp. 395]
MSNATQSQSTPPTQSLVKNEPQEGSQLLTGPSTLNPQPQPSSSPPTAPIPPQPSTSTVQVKPEPVPEPLSLSQPLAGPSTLNPQPQPLSYPHAPPAPPQPSTSTAYVKPEPVSEPLPLSEAPQPSTSHLPTTPIRPKAEPDVKPRIAATPPPPQPQLQLQQNEPLLPAATHKTYKSADEIDYTPENALQEGTEMAKTIGSYLKRIDTGTQLRNDVWLREVESLKSQGAPRTMIAVCGATGAGKSSLLNAVLDDNIVPTSGMRACTAVVTEIAYHDKNTIAADIEFLALSEWKAELEVLLEDLVDENGRLKRLTDLRNDSGVAWHKMHAVYPTLLAERMIRMTPDEIIASNPEVQRILGSTRKIECPNSERFATEITKYIDSKDNKRDKDKDKNKKKKSEPALWPLIRFVRVRCKSEALSCGAVLVDLPGVADANLARSSIAKEYMKKCDCIWIAAPITRAVDDKTAKDLLGEAFRTQLMNGNYDDSTITFIATKTDDLSCTEVIGALGLDDDPELQEIEGELDIALAGTEEWTGALKVATADMKDAEAEMKKLRPLLLEYKEHLAALRNGEEFEPFLTAPNKTESPSSKKRTRGGGGRKAKRRRNDNDEGQDDDMDDFIVDDDEDDAMVEDALSANDNNDNDDDDDVIVIDSDSDDIVVLSDSDEDEIKVVRPASEAEPVTEASLKATIARKEAELGAIRVRVNEHKATRQEAAAKLNEFKKSLNKLQKDKNSFCSIKRNEYSREVLKEDFRAGLKQLDQADAESKNPDTFDPSVDLRDYAAINLPVFTCSSRDYIRIKKQVKGDGGPSCFIDADATEVPALQKWCHELTVSARERSARSFLKNITTFLHSVLAYLDDDSEGVSTADRTTMADRWASNVLPSEYGGNMGLTQAHRAQPQPVSPPVPKPYTYRGRRYQGPPPPDENSLSGMYIRAQQLQAMQQLMPQGEQQKGISFRLRNSMRQVVEDCVAQLKRVFRHGIEERCQSGARKAMTAAVDTSDAFAASMHWATYRATLRRHGEWKSDLNADLIAPMTREIAASWAQVFESDLFAPMERATRQEITKLLQEIEDTAPAGLKDRCKAQSQTTLKEAQVVTGNILQNIKTAMTNEQKEISRCLTPHVKNHLVPGYEEAFLERGTGSVARQKAKFHDHVVRERVTVFNGGTKNLFDKLDTAAESIGVLLQVALNELSEKVEVSMSTLWEVRNDARGHLMKRRELVKRVEDMLGQIKLWATAGKRAHNPGGGSDVGDEDHEAHDEVDAMMMPASEPESQLENPAALNPLAYPLSGYEDEDEENEDEDGDGEDEDEDEEEDEEEEYYRSKYAYSKYGKYYGRYRSNPYAEDSEENEDGEDEESD